MAVESVKQEIINYKCFFYVLNKTPEVYWHCPHSTRSTVYACGGFAAERRGAGGIDRQRSSVFRALSSHSAATRR